MITPTTPGGLGQYDQLEPGEAAMVSWRRPGPRPGWHRQAQEVVRAQAPALAWALEHGNRHGVERALKQPLPPEVRRAMPLLARAGQRAGER